jgi:PEGA domain
MKTSLTSSILISVLLFTQACSLVSPSSTNISVVTEPPGARVVVNGNNVGMSPTVYPIKRDQPVTIMITKNGYEAATRSLQPKLSTTGIIDIVGGCVWLFPFFGLLAPGAWDIDNPNVSVMLSPDTGR